MKDEGDTGEEKKKKTSSHKYKNSSDTQVHINLQVDLSLCSSQLAGVRGGVRDCRRVQVQD